jgi:hypothetical protein
MQKLLNLTHIIEKNPKVYASIIAGIAICLVLFVAEAVHVQKFAESLATHDQVQLRQAIQPLAQCYTWARVVVLIAAVLWSSLEFSKTKKQLGL